MNVEEVPLSALREHPANPRQGDLGSIIESIKANGWASVIVAQKGGVVLAGNHRLKAARELGMETVPVLWLDVDEETALRILLADNRTSDLASWDDRALAGLLVDLQQQSATGLTGLGWDTQDLDALIAEVAKSDGTGRVDPGPGEPPKTPVTQPGDLWVLGEHRLLCGDCRVADDVERVMDGAQINVAFTSPPYAEQRAYDESSGFKPIPPAEYVEWFQPVAENVSTHLAGDGSWFVNIKPSAEGLDTELYVFDLVLAHVREWGWHFATEFCWERGGMPGKVWRRFKNEFEPVYQFAMGDWKMRPSRVTERSGAVPFYVAGTRASKPLDREQGTGALDFGAAKSEGDAYPGNRLPRFSSEALGHSAAFPVGLPAWFTKAYSDPGDTVFDPFAGSGSTLMAAHQEGRKGYGIEISPGYCDVIVNRWQDFTGLVAHRVT